MLSIRGEETTNRHTYVGSTSENCTTLTFKPQGQHMLSDCHALYVYQVCGIDSSSTFWVHTRKQTNKVTHATDHSTHDSATAGVGNNDDSLNCGFWELQCCCNKEEFQVQHSQDHCGWEISLVATNNSFNMSQVAKWKSHTLKDGLKHLVFVDGTVVLVQRRFVAL